MIIIESIESLKMSFAFSSFFQQFVHWYVTDCRIILRIHRSQSNQNPSEP